MVGPAEEMAALAGVLWGPDERAHFDDKLAGPIIQRDQEQIIGDSQLVVHRRSRLSQKGLACDVASRHLPRTLAGMEAQRPASGACFITSGPRGRVR